MVYGKEGLNMCGRYVVYTDEEYADMQNIMREVEKKLNGEKQLKIGEICPTDLAPVITTAGVVPMAWGFPRPNGGRVVINAKAETAAEKEMFRNALFSRRMVVPSTGFFEWRQVEGKKLKDKYLLRLPNTPMLYMAGLYSVFRQPDGRRELRFVIITTAANGSVSQLHDRMPVILSADETGEWMSSFDMAGRVLSRPGPELTLTRVS